MGFDDLNDRTPFTLLSNGIVRSTVGLQVRREDGPFWTIVKVDRFTSRVEHAGQVRTFDSGMTVESAGGRFGRLVAAVRGDVDDRVILLDDRLRHVARELSPDPSWIHSSELEAVIDLILSEQVTAATELRMLVDGDAPWLDSLAVAWGLVMNGAASSEALRNVDHRGSEQPTTLREAAASPSEPLPMADATADESPSSDFDWDTWNAAGFARPETARQWWEDGFGVAEAADWYDLDVRGPVHARSWTDRGWSPATASRWLLAGVDDPRTATAWDCAGLSPADARQWADVPFDSAMSCASNGVTASQLEDFTRHGVSVEVAAAWLCSEPDRRGVMPALRMLWARAGSGPAEAEEWGEAGVHDPSDAKRWAMGGFTAGDAAEWIASEVIERSAAERWIRAGVNASTAAAWVALGMNDPSALLLARTACATDAQVRTWLAGELTPSQITTLLHDGMPVETIDAWIERNWSFGSLRVWSRAGFHPDVADAWFDAGMAVPAEAESWIAATFTPGEATRWVRAGVVQPVLAARWRRSGFTPRAAASWAAAGAREPEEAVAWTDAGVNDAAVAAKWCVLDQSAEDAECWLEAGFNVETAAPWIRAGVEHAAEARKLVSLRAKPNWVERWRSATRRQASTLIGWLEAGVALEMALGWAKVGFGSPHEVAQISEVFGLDDAAALVAAGTTIAEIRRLASTPLTAAQRRAVPRSLSTHEQVESWRASDISPADWPGWMAACPDASAADVWCTEGLEPTDLVEAKRRTGLRAHDVFAWLAAGLTPSNMVEAFEEGVQDPAAWSIHLSGGSSAYATWLESGEDWLTTAGLNRIADCELLEMVFESGQTWASSYADVFGVVVPSDWLDDQLERAFHLARDLTSEPRWPIVFEDGSITIVLDASRPWAVAWVAVDGEGVAVSFHTDTLEIRADTDSPSWEYATGLALSWYIDCCIALTALRPLSFAPKRVGKGGTGFNRAAARWVPRPSFAAHVEEVASQRREPPEPHWVKGHRRRLKRGHRPSIEARLNAPVRVRKKLGPNDTWVSEHTRGGTPQSDELRTYLTKYSALADAMAMSQR
jgi:hypothetical protein